MATNLIEEYARKVTSVGTHQARSIEQYKHKTRLCLCFESQIAAKTEKNAEKSFFR
jgi:hypothetical protein